MRSTFPGLSLPTKQEVTASVTWTFPYFAYSFTSHIPGYAVHRITVVFAPAVERGAWPTTAWMQEVGRSRSQSRECGAAGR